MALTDLQKRIMQRLSLNRSQSSYLAGGLILNLNWPRRSDDIDIFHDTDEEVSEVAKKDISGFWHLPQTAVPRTGAKTALPVDV